LRVTNEIVDNEGVLEVPRLEESAAPEPVTAEMIAEKEKKELRELKYQNYLINFKDRVEAWNKAHDGKLPPPIRYDTEYGDFVWVNREMRRGK
jgi:hypothetical protein